MLSEKIKLTVSLRLDANDWGLCTEKPHPESVARQINMEVARAVNESKNWFDAFEESENVLLKFEHYKANEQKGKELLHEILEMVHKG
jgi:hypothetical protein